MTRTRAWMLGCALAVAVAAGWMFLPDQEPDYSHIKVATTADLERELETLRQRLEIPGMAAAIADRDRIVWARGFGWADVEKQRPVNPDTTSFHLASVTKPYAATIVLQLADEGRLQLDSRTTEFGVEVPADQPVRIWHLLSHTSRGNPGTVFRYDARAFGTLTTIIERAGGRPFATELTERIVRKLSLEHTGPNPREVDRAACRAQASNVVLGLCGDERSAERARAVFGASRLDRAAIDADLAVGYARQFGRQFWPAGLFGPMRPEQHLTELFASAGLVASAGDVLRFSMALDQGRLVTSSMLARAYTPALSTAAAGPTFGLGWFVQQHHNLSLIWHFGQAFESSSLLVKIPAEGVSFVVLANSDGLSRRRRLGDHGDLLRSPAAALFLTWFASGRAL